LLSVLPCPFSSSFHLGLSFYAFAPGTLFGALSSGWAWGGPVGMLTSDQVERADLQKGKNETFWGWGAEGEIRGSVRLSTQGWLLCLWLRVVLVSGV
jgi:hypothetical protein